MELRKEIFDQIFNNKSNDLLNLKINCYLDNKFKDLVSLSIIETGIITLSNSYIVKNLNILKSEFQKNNLSSVIISDFALEYLVDSIRICIAFENYFKHILLSKDYIIHLIDRNFEKELFTKQQKAPINKLEIEQKNYRTVLKNTLSFSLLLSENYQEIIEAPKEINSFLTTLNEKRNELHFAVSSPQIFNRDLIKNIESIIKFRDEKMMLEYNRLKRLHTFNSFP